MAKELTEEEKEKIKSKSTSKILEEFYAAQKKKTGKSESELKKAGSDSQLKKLQDEADAEDAKFNADLAAKRELKDSQVNSNIVPKLTKQEDKPIAEPKYTEAGQYGRDIIEGLKSGIKSQAEYAQDVGREYIQQPIINTAIRAGNLRNAGKEFIAGMAGYPKDYGRYPLKDIPTRFDEKPKDKTEEQPQPIQEPPQETETAPKEALKKAYAVVFAGSRANKNATFDNPEDAKKYYNEVIKAPKEDRTFSSMNEAANFYAKEAGTKVNKNKKFKSLEELKNYYESKGSVKGGVITLSPQEKETAQEQAERIAYGQTKKQTEDRKALKQKLTETGKQAWDEAKKVRDAENAANKASFQKFQESVGSDRQALDAYNEYNKDQSLLKKAYNAALKNENYGAAIKIKDQISRTSANVPVEMGQRQKYFREQAPAERTRSIERETLRRKKEADDLAMFEKNKKANEIYMASNPDAVLNPTTQVKQSSDEEDSYLNFGKPFKSF